MEISEKVVQSKYRGKLVSVADFRQKYAGGVTAQAISYAIKKDLIDYMEVSPTVRVIVLTEKTLAYTPNAAPARAKRTRLRL